MYTTEKPNFCHTSRCRKFRTHEGITRARISFEELLGPSASLCELVLDSDRSSPKQFPQQLKTINASKAWVFTTLQSAKRRDDNPRDELP